jgi:hypothetical protein
MILFCVVADARHKAVADSGRSLRPSTSPLRSRIYLFIYIDVYILRIKQHIAAAAACSFRPLKSLNPQVEAKKACKVSSFAFFIWLAASFLINCPLYNSLSSIPITSCGVVVVCTIISNNWVSVLFHARNPHALRNNWKLARDDMYCCCSALPTFGFLIVSMAWPKGSEQHLKRGPY